jgi:uncharacterized protein with beta-barrel porin domain
MAPRLRAPSASPVRGLAGPAAAAPGQHGARIPCRRAWRHAYGDVIPKVSQTFAGCFSSFTVAGVPIDRDAFVSETSLDYAVSQRVTVGLSYSGQYGRRATDSAFKGHVDVELLVPALQLYGRARR